MSSIQQQDDTLLKLEDSILVTAQQQWGWTDEQRLIEMSQHGRKPGSPTPISARGTKPKAIPSILLCAASFNKAMQSSRQTLLWWNTLLQLPRQARWQSLPALLMQTDPRQGCHGFINPLLPRRALQRCQFNTTMSSQRDTDHAEISKPEQGNASAGN